MADPDVILYLYSNDGEKGQASHTIGMAENESRRLSPRSGATLKPSKPHATPGRREREKTTPPEERTALADSRCLAVRFSDSARSRFGVVVGSDKDANLILEDEKGVSGFHFAFTFDDQNRPIVRDLGSTWGTRVSYDGEYEKPRRNFDWLLQGPRLSSISGPLVLFVTNEMQFRVVVPPHDTKSVDYTARVARFREGTAETEDLLKALAVKSRDATRAPTEAQTPLDASGAVVFKRFLGEGSFGTVTYAWNTTTGDEYALKEPKKDFRLRDWRKEADIMESVSHKHIVAFHGATWTPQPQLKFEFMRGGSLSEYEGLSTLENTQILCQLLSALNYLHGLHPPVGHRDIKPENILVKYRRPSGIYVKFADFGLAKAAEKLRTVCGTPIWTAPELYSRFGGKFAVAEENYSAAVDIYSCGLVVASKECGLPKFLDEYDDSPTAWIDAVLAHVQRRAAKGSDLLSFLLDTMLVVDPEEQKPAPFCHGKARKLLKAMRTRDALKQKTAPLGHTGAPRLLHGTSDSSSDGFSDSSSDGFSDCSNEGPASLDVDGDDSEDDESTPSPSIHKGRRITIYGGLDEDEASTVRPKYPKTSPDPSMIADLGYYGESMIDYITNQTESQISQDSGASDPASRQCQGLDRPAVAESEKSTLDDVVRGPQAENYGVASSQGGRTQSGGISSLVRRHLGGEVQHQAQIPRQVSIAAEEWTQQSARKRTRPGSRAPLASTGELHADPPADVEAAALDRQEVGSGNSAEALPPSKRNKSTTIKALDASGGQ